MPDASSSHSISQFEAGEFLELLDVEPLDKDLFRSRRHKINVNNALFGGQVLAQSLVAAIRSVDPERKPHSLHGYFLRAGSGEHPVIFQVERTRDGGSFTTRRVVGLQFGVPIFHMEASFQRPEAGLQHQEADAGPAPDPMSLPALDEMSLGAEPERFRGPERFEIRPLNAWVAEERDLPTHRRAWLRIARDLPDSEEVHYAALAYASDYWMTVPSIAAATGVRLDDLMVASLDHALWFHRPVRADDWLLYDLDCPIAEGGRMLSRGQFFDARGRLVASSMQEQVVRIRKPR